MAVNVAAVLFSTVFDAYIMAHEQFKFQQKPSDVHHVSDTGYRFCLAQTLVWARSV